MQYTNAVIKNQPNQTAAMKPTKYISNDNKITIAEETKSFGFNDNRGREIGISYGIYAHTIIKAPAESTWLVAVPLYEATELGNQIFRACFYATRNGKSYGSIPLSVKFATIEEATDWLKNRIYRYERDNRRKFATA